jgi:hypothetical protein
MTTPKNSEGGQFPYVHSKWEWPPRSVRFTKYGHPNKVAGKKRRAVVWDFHGPVANLDPKLLENINQEHGYQLTEADLLYYYWGCNPELPLSYEEMEQSLVSFAQKCRDGHGYKHLSGQPNIKKVMDRVVAAGYQNEIWTWTWGIRDARPGNKMLGTGISKEGTYELIEQLGLPVSKDQIRFINPHDKAKDMRNEGYLLIVENNFATAMEASQHALAVIVTPELQNQMIPDSDQNVFNRNILRLDQYEDLGDAVIDTLKVLDAEGNLRTRS